MRNKTLKAFSSKLITIAQLASFITLTTFVTLPVRALTLVQERNSLQSNAQISWSSLGKVLNPLAPNTEDYLPNSCENPRSVETAIF